MNTQDKTVRWVAWLFVVACAILAAVIVLNRPKPKAPTVKLGVLEGKATVGVLKMSGGKVTEGDSASQTLVGSGMRLLIGLICGDSTANPFDDSCWFAIGADSTTTDTSMTALQDTTPNGYAMCDSVSKTTTSLTWWKTWASAVANDTWGEISIQNDSAGTMLDRRTGSWGIKTTADTWITYFKYSVN